ncbi:MAG TPA: ABC transporter permease [Terracidiphilus sp.]|nr:ABC transporter permease [Terracidiphilus sp.]
MKPLLMITWTNIRLSYRAKVAFFFMFVMPVGFFFIYCGLIAHGQPDQVAGLMQPLVILLAITSGLYGVGGTLVGLRERDILHRFHLAPLTAVQIVMSNILATYITFIPIVILMFAMARFLYRVPLPADAALGLLAVLSLGYMAMGGLSMVVAGLVNTSQESSIVLQVLFFVLLFLSGASVPLAHMPHFVQSLSLCLPPTLMILSGQGLLIAHHRLYLHVPELIGLAFMAISSLALATTAFRWENDGRPDRRRLGPAVLAILPSILVGIWLNSSSSVRQNNNYLLSPSTQITQPAQPQSLPNNQNR